MMSGKEYMFAINRLYSEQVFSGEYIVTQYTEGLWIIKNRYNDLSLTKDGSWIKSYDLDKIYNTSNKEECVNKLYQIARW